MTEEAKEQRGIMELERLYLTFAQAVLARLAEWGHAATVPPPSRRRVEFVRDHVRAQTQRETIDVLALLAMHTTEIAELPETQACSAAHLEGGLWGAERATEGPGMAQGALDATPDRVLPVIRYFLLPMLAETLRRNLQADATLSIALTDDQIVADYRRHARALWLVAQSSLLIPLLGLVSRVPAPVALTDRIWLRPFGPEEKTALWNAEGGLLPSMMAKAASLSPARSVLVLLRETDDTAPESERQAALEDVGDVLTALRLYRAGAVAALPVFALVRGAPAMGSVAFHTLPYGYVASPEAPIAPASYVLELDDVPHVRALVQRVRTVKQEGKGLHVALRRFNQSYVRELLEDRVTDLAVALDSSVLAGQTSELRFRLKLRGTSLLAHTARQPRQTRDLLEALYDTRSQIVHEGALLSDLTARRGPGRRLRAAVQPVIGQQVLTTQNIVLVWEDLVRDILREYVERLAAAPVRTDVKTVNDRLEDALFDHMASLRWAVETQT